MTAVIDIFKRDYAVLTLEKYGIKPGENPNEDNGDRCSEAFYSKGTVSQRLDDYRQVLQEIESAQWWNGELALFGGSEGGLTMAALSSQVDAKAAVLISSIGNQPFGQIVLKAMGSQNKNEAEEAFAAAKRDPNGTRLFAGSSYAYWADTIDRDAKEYLLKSKTAFLIVQGSNNTQPTSDEARAIVDAFIKEKRCNITYFEFAGLDHSFIDPQGNSRLSEVTGLTKQWLDILLSGTLEPQCND